MLKRTSTLFLLLFLSQSILFGQQNSLLNRVMNVRFNNTSIEEILKSLETEDLSFVYSPEVFDVKKRVSINRQNTRLSDILIELFAGQDMEMREMKGQVLLRKKLIPVNNEETTIDPLPKKEELPKPATPQQEKRKEDSLQVTKPKLQETTPIEQTPEAQVANNIDSFGSNSAENKTNLIARTTNYIPEWPIKPYSPLKVTNSPLNLDNAAITPRYAIAEQDKSSVWDEIALLNKRSQAEKEKEREEKQKPERKFRAGLASYTGYTEFDGTPALLLGGRVMYYPSVSVGIGVGGNALLSKRFYNAELDEDIRLEGGYGGLTFEYTLFPQSTVHLNIPITVGAGGFTYVNADNPIGAVNPSDSQAFFAFEGGAELEVNVAKFMKMGLGLSYRTVSGTSLLNQDSQEEIINASALEGMSFGIVVKFGRF